ncbi:MAG: hypothetical protein A2017_11205 [Lentisphaerae bacterium GWF2_44_16]|nr:MAG: hypothetical protein A2017_11205 [Lentisphaerae bacterium GWF2_44_16]
MNILYRVGFLVFFPSAVFGAYSASNGLEGANPGKAFKQQGMQCVLRFEQKREALARRLPKMRKQEMLNAYPHALFLCGQIKAFLSASELILDGYQNSTKQKRKNLMVKFREVSNEKQDDLLAASARLKTAYNIWAEEYLNFESTFKKLEAGFKEVSGVMGQRLGQLFSSSHAYIVFESQLFERYSALTSNILRGFHSILEQYQASLGTDKPLRPLNITKVSFVLVWISHCSDYLFNPEHGGKALKCKEHSARLQELKKEIADVLEQYNACCCKKARANK